MNNYIVSPEFKTQATEILNTKKFSAVFPYMNLVNRDGFTYNEQELNSIVQFLGDFPYSEVAEFFQLLPGMVSQQEGASTDNESSEEKVNELAETASEN